MDLTQYLKYNNLKINLMDLKKSISGWSYGITQYSTEKIISVTPFKTNTYYILNDIKFSITSQVLIKIDNDIQPILVSDLYDKFLNNEKIEILNYKLENILINKIEFIEKASFKNYCTFLNLKLTSDVLYVPYSEYSILIKGVLFN